jgi:predicted DNA-binding transcriptional regulator AlpA
MAAKKRGKKTSTASGELLTLSEVSNRTEISMPTLQRYKKLYQDRIPSVGEGRKQRYPEHSLPVFKAIKEENIGKRGRPRKSASTKGGGQRSAKQTPPPKKTRAAGGNKSAAGRSAKQAGKQAGKHTGASAGASSSSDLLTLNEISRQTGISYPTLVRYKKLHLAEIPHEGKGRAVRFHPEAVEVFQELRGRSTRGPRRKSAAGGKRGGRKAATGRAAQEVSTGDSKRLNDLEKAHAKLQKRFDALLKKLQKPIV